LDDEGARERELRARCRLAGIGLVLSALGPVETAHEGARSLVRLAPDLRAVSVVVLTAPALAGILLLVASWFARTAFGLALVACGSIGGACVLAAAGRDALAWDLVRIPDARSPTAFTGLFALALLIAASRLRAEGASQRGRALLVAASGCALVYLALPSELAAPLVTVVRALRHVAMASGAGNVASAGLLALIALAPALAVFAAFAAWRAPSRPRVLAAAAFVGLAAPLAMRELGDPFGPAPGALASVVEVVTRGSSLYALTSAIALLGASDLALAPRAAPFALAVGIAGWFTARHARPERMPEAVRLGPGSAAADRFFGETLPRWVDARSAGDFGEHAAHDAAILERAMVADARELGADVGHAVADLASELVHEDVGERRFYTLVERLNLSVLCAGLPYYVEPTGIVVTPGDPPRRTFPLAPYRVETARRFMVGSQPFDTLHVRALAPSKVAHDALGFTRDVEPFALIARDAIDAHRAELERLASATPPRCAAPSENDAADRALRACGDMLAALAREHDLGAALVAMTERHELQHAIDGPRPSRSRWLDDRLALYPRDERLRTLRELRAYFAQATAEDPAPRLTVVRLVRMAHVTRRGLEHEVALLALEVLGGEANIVTLDDAVLRDRARAAFRGLAGADLPVVSSTPGPPARDAGG
jgi:hypothetical protein